jgi:hypothetical protein
MARFTFGATVADYVVKATSGGTLRLTDASLTFWDAETGGTRYTDLLLEGAAVGSIEVGPGGQIPSFQGPDSVTDMWVEAHGSTGGRVRIVSAPAYAELAGFADAAAASATTASGAATSASASADAAALDAARAATTVASGGVFGVDTDFIYYLTNVAGTSGAPVLYDTDAVPYIV